MVFWVDRNGRKYWKAEIDNRYLSNIANALLRGVGDPDFLSDQHIEEIYEECFNRGILSSEESHEQCEEAKNAMERKKEFLDQYLEEKDVWDGLNWG